MGARPNEGATDATITRDGLPAPLSKPEQLACDQCGAYFQPRHGSGGSRQRFCSEDCRKTSNGERQRSGRKRAYAGPTALPAGQPSQQETPIRARAATALRPWETGVLDIADCERTEFVIALKDGETAGTRIETWPPEVRAFIDQHIARWVEENEDRHTVRAMTVAAPKYEAIQSCVVILHHSPRRHACADFTEPQALDGALLGPRGVS
jgi:hypothetical protein